MPYPINTDKPHSVDTESNTAVYIDRHSHHHSEWVAPPPLLLDPHPPQHLRTQGRSALTICHWGKRAVWAFYMRHLIRTKTTTNFRTPQTPSHLLSVQLKIVTLHADVLHWQKPIHINNWPCCGQQSSIFLPTSSRVRARRRRRRDEVCKLKNIYMCAYINI